MPFRVKNKDIAQNGYTPGCKEFRAARAGTRQQAHDEACRARILEELIKTAECRNRTEAEDEMTQNKRARVEADAQDNAMRKERAASSTSSATAKAGSEISIDQRAHQGGSSHERSKAQEAERAVAGAMMAQC